jgi:hypothetical protein
MDHREEPCSQCTDFIEQSKCEYRSKTTDTGIRAPSTPPNLAQTTTKKANDLPPTPWDLEQNFRNKAPEELLIVLDVCGKLLAGKKPVLIFDHTLNDIKGERSS